MRCAVRLRGANWSVQGHRRPALSSAQAHFERARGDKQGGSAPRLPRPHLGSGTTPSNYLFERHAQAQRGAPTPSPPLRVPLRAQLRHCAPSGTVFLTRTDGLKRVGLQSRIRVILASLKI